MLCDMRASEKAREGNKTKKQKRTSMWLCTGFLLSSLSSFVALLIFVFWYPLFYIMYTSFSPSARTLIMLWEGQTLSFLAFLRIFTAPLSTGPSDKMTTTFIVRRLLLSPTERITSTKPSMPAHVTGALSLSLAKSGHPLWNVNRAMRADASPSMAFGPSMERERRPQGLPARAPTTMPSNKGAMSSQENSRSYARNESSGCPILSSDSRGRTSERTPPCSRHHHHRLARRYQGCIKSARKVR